jgi:hypothetical protein
MSDNFQPFVCGECGDIVSLQPPKDDFLVMRLNGYIFQVVIPEHLVIPRCSYCGTVYLSYSRAEELAKNMGGTLP